MFDAKNMTAIILSFISLAIAMPASAATSVYRDSNAIVTEAQVTNTNNAVGAVDGQGATMEGGTWIAWETDDLYNDFDITIEIMGLTGSSSIIVYVGQVDGAGDFTNLHQRSFTVTNGMNRLTHSYLTTACMVYGGCDAFIIFNDSGADLVVDTADLTSEFIALAPEPTSWALMLVGFILAGSQLKRLKKKSIKNPKMQHAFA